MVTRKSTHDPRIIVANTSRRTRVLINLEPGLDAVDARYRAAAAILRDAAVTEAELRAEVDELEARMREEAGR